jgi:chemotaxis protein methyltransferase CheR
VTTPGAIDLDRFRSAIAQRLGLLLDASRRDQLEQVLKRRLHSRGGSLTSYLDQLEQRPTSDELRALAQELTIGETYFFRHYDQFRAFIEVAAPDRMKARDVAGLSVLSAACSTGEEPYSLAMLIRERYPEARGISIRGLDINPTSLEKARAGRYSPWALRETPPALQKRWFKEEHGELVLDPAIRAMVRFEETNLVDDAPLSPDGEAIDVIFCRNALMYFSAERAQAVVKRLWRAMAPGAYFFLGHAETLRTLSGSFHLLHTHETFYYQRKDAEDPAPEREADWDRAGWADSVERSSERISALIPTPATLPPEPIPHASALEPILSQLQQERFADALDALDALTPGSAGTRDVLLLRAALLTHSGQLEEASAACKALLESDELSAGAHYLLALCREGAGDKVGAVHHSQTARYLDPTFAMPRLHLGLLAQRAGDRHTARSELTGAIPLLEREEAARLVLFGGGFGRSALVTLCRTELDRTRRSR